MGKRKNFKKIVGLVIFLFVLVGVTAIISKPGYDPLPIYSAASPPYEWLQDTSYYFDPDDDLIIHYTFDNDKVRWSGGKRTGGRKISYFLVKDSSGNNNDGKFYRGSFSSYVDGVNDYINTPYGDDISEATFSSYVDGKDGKGINFDGANDYIDIGNAFGLELEGTFTISVWVKLDSGLAPDEEGSIFWKQANRPGLAVVGQEDGYVYLYMRHSSRDEGYGEINVNRITPGVWTHITYVFDGTWMIGYINGVRGGSGYTNDPSLYSLGGEVYIGWDGQTEAPCLKYEETCTVRRRTGERICRLSCISYGEETPINVFKGIMDEVRIYDYVLSDEEIVGLYEGSEPPETYTCCLDTADPLDPSCFQDTIESCRAKGGAVMECIPSEIFIEEPPGTQVNYTKINETAQSGWLQNLTNAVISTGISSKTYVPGTYDCDNFANDLEKNLTALGYDATYTVYWWTDTKNKKHAHAVTDVHAPDGSLIFIEPQTGKIIDMDFDGDGKVEARYNEHKTDHTNPTDGGKDIEVYDDQAAADAAGCPKD